MGYLATEIIVLLAGAAVLGVVIGWALFGLGKGKATAGAATAPVAKSDGDLKAERDARKKAEMRILELEARETNFTDRIQERDTKIAELMHQLDDQAKYRVQSVSEVAIRDHRIEALEAQLREREGELARLTAEQAASAPTAAPQPDPAISARVTELEAELAALKAASALDKARVAQLELENEELRATLVTTANAAPTTAEEKDRLIARLNEEISGLRAAYEAAEQALEEQDAAIDKLTRDLLATQQKLSSASGAPAEPGAPPIAARPAEARPTTLPQASAASVAAPQPAPKAPPTPAPPPPAPPAALEVGESTVAISLDALVSQIDAVPAVPKPAPAPVAPAAAAPATASPSVVEADVNESTMAISLDDLVKQIDAAPAVPRPAPPAAAPVLAVAPPPPADESTMAISLDDLVRQIDAAPMAPKPPPVVAPSAPPPPADESTMAISLDDLVRQIDAAPMAPKPPATPVVAPPPPPPAALDINESTVAISLADLVSAVDSDDVPVDLKLDVAPAPPGANDDLQRIRGVGPATAKRLNSAGIRTWAQVAQLSDRDLDQVADLLKISLDKIKREQWVEQARALTSL